MPGSDTYSVLQLHKTIYLTTQKNKWAICTKFELLIGVTEHRSLKLTFSKDKVNFI